MISFFNWFPPTLVGMLFIARGSLKLFGLYKGVVGGRDKPLIVKLCGT